MKKRQLIFLRDVLIYTFTAFGGPQAHIAVLLREFVEKRKYITEDELMELNALSQVLPGPSSTQTLVGIAWKVGGLRLAIITFLIWILPSATIMCMAAISYSMVANKAKFAHVISYVQPIAVGIVAYATYTFANKFLKTRISTMLAIGSLIVTLILQNAYAFPILILLGGIISSAMETQQHENELRVKLYSNVNPNKVAYFIGILLFFAALGAVVNQTSPLSLPIRLFENFYRNGILIFGGGQVLVPLMYTEFVEVKHYLSRSEFLSGYALQQALPGPTFSFTSFLGGITLGNKGYSIWGQVIGSLVAVIGINTPGLILILFIVPFWEDLKKITRIKNSLSGINAVAVGFMATALILLVRPFGLNWTAYALMIGTFLVLHFTKIKTPIVIIIGVVLGIIF
ncbi:chromate efflux transporter [Mucilaginibacter rubeus]|uniref:Chromate efflux transporter n=1 Tax=Mucilaginibacter rubeus TaxID=2027860 RepID=A0AAE6MHX5_9SPHI|nr:MULTISPECIES: chromate efflux transporter [Mucilaginibacter]QEM04100.1 chromate efflux transporter [Mucilaginibacter rubeus]QEM16703.1 chromate efflux transporter [Mucilaginibacter gossypii]QTE46822.1 chromate efflux transporter [Mucilaginibacter rubeus]QTE53419.1 chromate efflux transporter [Mucilaginibacter rubeus]QTE58505.1 chromate efflux transporter [Mucilaginibacter rubeus]